MATLTRRIVLVVEDDDSVREAIGRLLDAAGFESTTYASAEALLAAGPLPGASCVISDLRLPTMSGLELLAQMRLLGDWPPFILMTAHDAPGLRKQALRYGAAGYLVKPLACGELLDAVQRVLELSKQS